MFVSNDSKVMDIFRGRMRFEFPWHFLSATDSFFTSIIKPHCIAFSYREFASQNGVCSYACKLFHIFVKRVARLINRSIQQLLTAMAILVQLVSQNRLKGSNPWPTFSGKSLARPVTCLASGNASGHIMHWH